MAERDEDPRCREQKDTEADRPGEVETRGDARRARGQHAPRRHERGRADRHVHEKDEAPVDGREESPDKRADGRANARRRAHDAELRATPARGQGLAEQSETVRDQRRGGDRLIQPEDREGEDRRSDRRTHRCQGEIHKCAEHHALAAETIADLAGDRLQRGHRDEV